MHILQKKERLEDEIRGQGETVHLTQRLEEVMSEIRICQEEFKSKTEIILSGIILYLFL